MLENLNEFLDNNIINSLINKIIQNKKNVLNNLDTVDTDRVIKDMKINNTQLTM